MTTLKFADTHNMVAFLSKLAKSEGFEKIVDFLNAHPIKKPKRKDTQIPQSSGPTDNVADEVVNEEMDDSLERASTTAISLDAERVKKLERRNKSRTHGLKRMYRVGSSRRVESSKDEGLGEEDACKQGRIADIDANKDIYLANVHIDEDMFGVNDLDGDEVIVDNVDVVKTAKETRSVVKEVTTVIEKAKLVSAAEETVNAAATIITLAKALAELKSDKPPTQGITTTATTITAASTRPKAKGIVIHKQEQAPTPTVSSQQPSQVKVQDKGKGKMVEPEHVKKLSKKDQLRLDEELAFKLQAEEEERLAREKAQHIEESNIA
ncbi:hypothetical protein Tco_1201388 [Tanacetum coccineum]